MASPSMANLSAHSRVAKRADGSALQNYAAMAQPGCLLCGGKGWCAKRVDTPFIGGAEAVPCACTQGAFSRHPATNIGE